MEKKSWASKKPEVLRGALTLHRILLFKVLQPGDDVHGLSGGIKCGG
jgi:hypothetical protein